jgi:hypothetical protein
LCDRDDRFGVAWCHTSLPGDQGGDRAATGRAPQVFAVDLGDDVHDAAVDRVTLPGQLRQLFEQDL